MSRRIRTNGAKGMVCMQRTRTVGLCVLTVLALSALVAAGAFGAAPEYGKCTKVAKGAGKFSGPTCTVAKAGGSYEWGTLASPVSFTTTMKEGTLATLETVNKEKVVCTGETGKGAVLNSKEIEMTPTFRGCENSKIQCESPGQPYSYIAMNPLQGELGVEKKGTTAYKNKLASNLYAQGNKGGTIVEFSCGGFVYTERGEVLFPVSANKMLTTATVKFVALKGKQKPERFEGGPKETMECSVGGGLFVQCGQTMAMIQTNAEPVEANTVF